MDNPRDDFFLSLRSAHHRPSNFWTALEVRVLIPDPARGAGFWFVSVNRSRSDRLTLERGGR